MANKFQCASNPFRCWSVIFGSLLFAALVLSGCEKKPPMTPAETALTLLSMHGLLGKTPGQRSKEAKESMVSEEELHRIFADLDSFDRFTAELFTGIVIGALAHNQSSLSESKNTTSASIQAGQATIQFVLVDNVWKISLEKTIPEELKEKAKIEKARYDAAKAAGEMASAASSTGS